MTAQKLSEWLKSQGYTPYPDRLSGAVWCASKRLPAGAPECLTNGERVAWHVRLHEVETGIGVHRAAELEIIAEGEYAEGEASCWYRLAIYSVSFTELRENLEAFEASLLAAWVCVC